ncbi:MAG: N-6 DNA methylase, partial [Bacteroidota bacterium]|nr:N-6 DNA methylase [Bacteroidota bacterium]
GSKAADTFADDQHKDLKADYIMANPPFNLKDWRAENELTDDPRWAGYEVPPKSNANYAWILNMIAKLSQNGVAGFILANGALSGGGEEYKIRKQIIENDLVEAIVVLPRNMFYSTDISVTLWILNRNKTQRTVEVKDATKRYRNRTGEVLFMDLRKWGTPYEKSYIELISEDIEKIAKTYHDWQQQTPSLSERAGEGINIPEFCKSATIEDIRANDYALMPSKYVEFIDRDLNIDFDAEMQRIQKKFKNVIKEEKQSQEELIKAFKSLGYEIG